MFGLRVMAAVVVALVAIGNLGTAAMMFTISRGLSERGQRIGLRVMAGQLIASAIIAIAFLMTGIHV